MIHPTAIISTNAQVGDDVTIGPYAIIGDHVTIGNGGCGPLTKQLQDAFFGLFDGRTADKWGWLEPV